RDGSPNTTQSVEGRRWKYCKLVDTPGLGGAHLPRGSSVLGQLAHEAVLGADVAIAYFDSRSQEVAAFAELKEWVTTYRKPVIAVLNVRNANWRYPPQVPSEAARRALSATVAQHAANITENFSALGMHQVPVVAL